MKSVLLNYARRCFGKDYFDDAVYDRDLDMSVLKKGDAYVPLIDAETVNMAVMTKTETVLERDDAFPMELVLKTKTFSHLESDDQSSFNY